MAGAVRTEEESECDRYDPKCIATSHNGSMTTEAAFLLFLPMFLWLISIQLRSPCFIGFSSILIQSDLLLNSYLNFMLRVFAFVIVDGEGRVQAYCFEATVNCSKS